MLQFSKENDKTKKYIKIIFALLFIIILLLVILLIKSNNKKSSTIQKNDINDTQNLQDSSNFQTSSKENFSILLDYGKELNDGFAIYADRNNPKSNREIDVGNIEILDNITLNWLPKDIDDSKYEGKHNGNNYIAYTFYVENQSKEVQNYWYDFAMTNISKNIDDAIRIVVYLNGERKVYAKQNNLTYQPENETIPFNLKNPIIFEKRKKFNPGDIDRITIIIFLEGADSDCTNEIIGGKFKLQMNFTYEYIERKGE